jgi:hypothetical protein
VLKEMKNVWPRMMQRRLARDITVAMLVKLALLAALALLFARAELRPANDAAATATAVAGPDSEGAVGQ